jgi:hypothetical protein
MDSTKPWWASTSIWLSLSQALLGILVASGVVSNDLAHALGGNLETIIGGLFATLGAVGVWARVTATKQIATPSTPDIKG